MNKAAERRLGGLKVRLVFKMDVHFKRLGC